MNGPRPSGKQKEQATAELERLLEVVGTKSDIARALDVTPQSIGKMYQRGYMAHTLVDKAAEVFKSDGFTLASLRPDLV